jgi:uroporphyrinogen-III synthase
VKTPVRVALTRASGGNDELAGRLRGEGFEIIECPLIRIELLDGSPIPVHGYDWIVVTSRVAVACLLGRAEGELPPVAAIGPGTADALRSRGVEPALVAATSTQEGLVAALPRPAGRVLFAGAEDARDVLVRELDADFVPLYRTVEDPPPSFPEVDLVVLSSGSAARSLARVERGRACVSIGPVTSEEARRAGLRIVAEASPHDVDGLADAVRVAASAIASSRS